MQILGAYVVFVVGMVAVALMAILCAAIRSQDMKAPYGCGRPFVRPAYNFLSRR